MAVCLVTASLVTQLSFLYRGLLKLEVMSRVSAPSGKIPNVWNDDGDDFEHLQLAANFDATDAELTRLDNERMPLGSVVMWWHRANADPAAPMEHRYRFGNLATAEWFLLAITTFLLVEI